MEDTFHALCAWSTIQHIWEQFLDLGSVDLASHSQFHKLISAVMDSGDSSFLSRFFTIYWGLWKYRNFKLFQSMDFLVYDIVENCFAFVENYQFVHTHQKIRNQVSRFCWQPPSCRIWKLNLVSRKEEVLYAVERLFAASEGVANGPSYGNFIFDF